MHRARHGLRPEWTEETRGEPNSCANVGPAGATAAGARSGRPRSSIRPRRATSSTRCPRRLGTSPQRRRGYPRAGAELPTGTRCSGAVMKGTTRSCVLGLTARRPKRNVDGSLGTPRRIAREAAGRQVGPPRKTIIGPRSSGLIGSWSQLPDRGPASPKTGSGFCSAPSRSAVTPSLRVRPSDREPSNQPPPRPGRRPTRRTSLIWNDRFIALPPDQAGMDPEQTSRPIDQTMGGLEERSNQWSVSPRIRSRWWMTAHAST